MFEETGCDGVMAVRGAKGNPWLFRDIRAALEERPVPKHPGISEIREMILRHARMEVEFKGENIAMREMRKQVAWYTAGCPHSSSLREAVNHVTAYRELEELLCSRLTEQV